MRTRMLLLFIFAVGALSCSSSPTQSSDVSDHRKNLHHFVHHAPRFFEQLKNQSDI